MQSVNVLIPCFRKQHMTIEMFYTTRCSFLHCLEQRLIVFARGCMEKSSAHGNISQIMVCYKSNGGICALPYKIFLSIKEIMTNVRSVRILV